MEHKQEPLGMERKTLESWCPGCINLESWCPGWESLESWCPGCINLQNVAQVAQIVGLERSTMALATRDADSFYVQDCRQVQNNTHSIQTLTGQISKLVGTMEAEKDFQHCRKMVDDAVRQASETKTILARIREHQHQAQNTAERNNRRMMYQKLSDNLAITARVLEDVVRRFNAEERRRSGGLFEAGIAAADVAGGNDQKPLLSANAGHEQMEALQNDKVQSLRKVDEDMLFLQRIYTDLASAAEEQTSTFDSLESHMARAAADVERGREEIEYTDKYNMAAKLKRRLWLAAGGIFALMVFGSVLSS